jgi:hypothetical protein
MKEIVYKYKAHTARLLRLWENIYSWLPVASLIDDHIFVTHGGISDITDLKKINKISRQKVSSIYANEPIHPLTKTWFSLLVCLRVEPEFYYAWQ